VTDIPQAVLSEHFQARIKDRRLVAAIFTTFQFEPSFFETEVLPVFLDIPLSHAPAIRIVQLDDALRTVPGRIAVYYDRHGLIADSGSAKLDVGRYPIRHPTGVFHPKNVIALVESIEADAEGRHARSLLCACSSANLTRAGWWENVECAHVEEIREGEHTLLGEGLARYVDALINAAEGRRADSEVRTAHTAARAIRDFLRSTTAREQRSIDGRLLTHFHDGRGGLLDFMDEAAGPWLRGLCLEVISPYFDGDGESEPLTSMIERFRPEEVRVYLPRNERGEAECSAELFSWVRKRACWGALSKELTRLGTGEDAKSRTVHAKVCRFFEPKRGGREILYVGSANLTTAAHRATGRGGNWETGFLVDVTTRARPDWWLSVETKRPPAFAPRDEDGGTATSGGTSLMLRFRWDTHQASACWGDNAVSPTLRLRHAGVTLLELSTLPSRAWLDLDPGQSLRIEQALISTSLLEVEGDGPEPGLLLVQEEGMSHRPSLLLDLSAADILRYWALLTPEQRAAFIEARAAITGDDDPLMARLAPLPVETTLFDRFAGIFQAFACLEERVRAAVADDKPREADYRLFGQKYDSLGTLLNRVLLDAGAGRGDTVEHYVVILCAKQLLRELARAFSDYWESHREDVRRLEACIGEAASIRAGLAASSPEMPAFLEWFDRWFLQRATALDQGDPS
jgi:hypothetical protein